MNKWFVAAVAAVVTTGCATVWPAACGVREIDGLRLHDCVGEVLVLRCVEEADGSWRIEETLDGARLPVVRRARLRPGFCR